MFCEARKNACVRHMMNGEDLWMHMVWTSAMKTPTFLVWSVMTGWGWGTALIQKDSVCMWLCSVVKWESVHSPLKLWGNACVCMYADVSKLSPLRRISSWYIDGLQKRASQISFMSKVWTHYCGHIWKLIQCHSISELRGQKRCQGLLSTLHEGLFVHAKCWSFCKVKSRLWILCGRQLAQVSLILSNLDFKYVYKNLFLFPRK